MRKVKMNLDEYIQLGGKLENLNKEINDLNSLIPKEIRIN